jgi:hypothetical protein
LFWARKCGCSKVAGEIARHPLGFHHKRADNGIAAPDQKPWASKSRYVDTLKLDAEESGDCETARRLSLWRDLHNPAFAHLNAIKQISIAEKCKSQAGCAMYML